MKKMFSRDKVGIFQKYPDRNIRSGLEFGILLIQRFKLVGS